MKRKPSLRKKYANGTNTQGVGPNNYIQSPNEVLNDYNIMLAEADKQVASNSVVPIVSLVGGLLQQGISMAGSFKKTPGATPDADTASAANGMNNVNQNVEVEGGEMYETPQGETGEFQGPSHEQGGIPLEVGEDVEEGTKIYSDRLKIGKETLAERKEARERKIANLEKVASQPLIDAALKNATQRKMMAIQKEEAADLQFQEQVNNMQTMADTMVKAFGTSMEGLQSNPIGDSMRYGSGTGAMGVTEYADGTGPDGIPLGFRFTDYDENGNYIGTFGPQNEEPDPSKRLTQANKALEEYLSGDTHKNATDSLTNMISKTETDTANMLAGNLPSSPNNITGIENSLVSSPFVNELASAPKMPLNNRVNPNSITGTAVNTVSPQSEIPTFINNFGENSDFLSNLQAEQDSKMYTPGQIGTAKVNPEGTMFSRGLEKGLGAVSKMGGVPGIGDLTGLFGNYLGATAGLKNAAESRSTDITHTNVYKNAGKESQKQLDNAMTSIEGSKAQAIVKATTNTQGAKKSGRNSARGVNQMRGMDWLYDTALNEQIASISANAAAQTADIYKSKSGVAMSTDQLKGQGEYQANMANEAAKDAYYTAKGLALRDQANAVKQGGKDINAIKQNKIIENLMKNYGTYGQVDVNTGLITNKPIPGQTQQVFTLNGKKYTTDSAGNLKLV